MYQKITFPNGLRLITVPSKNTQAVTVLVVVGAGSKYEREEENGVSHFLEHMFFKGTRKRPNALSVSETLDKVGGMYNAFTGKEYTGYFAKVASKHFDLALDWVSDIFLNSKIEAKEMEKERGVIAEELNMCLDTPIKYINDIWERLLYGNQPAGWEILGKRENILNLQRKKLLDYFKNHYSAGNSIICVSGNFNPSTIRAKIQKNFQPINKKNPKPKLTVKEIQQKPEILFHFKKTDQTHLCLGVRGYDLRHPKRYAQELLAIILGGNMSSRLFNEIREKRGLAYYVHSESESYTDSGYLATQAGVPHQKVAQVVSLILKEYKDIRDKTVSFAELKKAKDYLKGVLTLGLESSDAQASFYAGQELLLGKILTLQEKCVKIDKVTRKDISEAALEIFNSDKLNLALIGPHKQKQDFVKLLKL